MTLIQFQTDLCEKLRSDPALVAGEVAVLAEDSKTIDYEVELAIGKAGIVAVAVTPNGVYAGKTADGGIAIALRGLQVRINEMPVTNRGRANSMTALAAAQRVAALLHSPQCLFKGFTQEEDPDGTVQVAVTFDSQFILHPDDTNP